MNHFLKMNPNEFHSQVIQIWALVYGVNVLPCISSLPFEYKENTFHVFLS